MDASQAAGNSNKFSATAKEFVPRSRREKESLKQRTETEIAKEELETPKEASPNPCDGPDKKSFPWRAKMHAKADDEDDDDSTCLETSMSTSTATATASTDASSTPSEHEHEDVSEADLEVSPQSAVAAVPHTESKDDTQEFKVSSTSWAAMRRARLNSAASEQPTDEDIVRKMKSILNKLTIEKFPTLSKQLASCGIKTSLHLELLIHEVFEKATMQHHFMDMYADLCVVLQQHFAEHPISSDPSANMKKILLNACQASFERHLTVPAKISTLEGEERDAAEQMYKRQMIGNIRFVGALMVRKMLASKVLFAIMHELLHVGIPEALESLAALLSVVGRTLDQPDSQHRVVVAGIFDRIEALSKDASVKSRVRCLLRDVIELRAAGWEDTKPKKLEGPSTLEDVAQKVYGEGHREWDRSQSRYDWGYGNMHSRSDWGHGWCNQSGSEWGQGSMMQRQLSCQSGSEWGQGSTMQRQMSCQSGSEWGQSSTMQRQISSQSASEWCQGSPLAGRTQLKNVVHRFQDFCPKSEPSPSTPPGELHANYQQETADHQQKTADCPSEPSETCEAEVSEDQLETSEEEPYDKVACNKYIAEAFVALMTSHDVQQAVAAIAALDVPEKLQAEQLCDLLLFIVESGADMVRTFGFQLIVAVYMEGCWSKASLKKGLQTFEGLCSYGKVHATDLANIICVELVPAFAPLFQQGLLPADLLLQVATSTDEQASSSSKCDSSKDEKRSSEKRKRKTKKSLIDKAAEQQQQEQKQQDALWRLGKMMSPSVYFAPSVLYYADPQY
jgi:translation initiation factor 4G